MSRSFNLSVAGILASAMLLTQPGSAQTQQMATMQFGTQMMQAGETAFFGKLIPSVVSIRTRREIIKSG